MDPEQPSVNPESALHPDHQVTRQAQEESYNIENQDLKADRHRKEHSRTEQLRNVFSMGVVALVRLIFILVGLALLIVALHYFLPNNLHWVEDGKLRQISTVLFSGTLFAFLGLYVRDRI